MDRGGFCHTSYIGGRVPFENLQKGGEFGLVKVYGRRVVLASACLYPFKGGDPYSVNGGLSFAVGFEVCELRLNFIRGSHPFGFCIS